MNETAKKQFLGSAPSVEKSRDIYPRVASIGRTVRRDELMMLLIGLLVVATQRLGVPIGDEATVPLPVVIATVFSVASLAIRQSEISVRKFRWYLLLIIIATGSTLISGVVGVIGTSLPSLLLLALTYFISNIKPRVSELGSHVFQGVLIASVLGAGLAVVQSLTQSIAGRFIDPVQYVPTAFRVSGFNELYDLTYLGRPGQFKPNGIIFLEPSFLSLFSAIGILILLENFFFEKRASRLPGLPWLLLLILISGIALSESASGLVVLGASGPFVLWKLRRHKLLTGVLAALLAGLFAFGFFGGLLAKATEGSHAYTSTALRLTLPYDYFMPIWMERPLLGHGAGYSSHALEQIGTSGLQVSTVMKVLVEYGVMGFIALVILVAIAVAPRGAPTSVKAGLLSAWIVPSESLLNATLVFLIFFALPYWGSRRSAALTGGSIRG